MGIPKNLHDARVLLEKNAHFLKANEGKELAAEDLNHVLCDIDEAWVLIKERVHDLRGAE